MSLDSLQPNPGLKRAVDEASSSSLAPLVRSAGQEFQEQAVRFLREALDADLVFVGEFFGEDWERVRALAVSSTRLPEKPFEYDLRGSASELVLRQGLFVLREGASRMFPDSALARHLETEAFAGIPLFDSTNRPLGLIVIHRSKAWETEEPVRNMLELLRARVATELEHRRTLGEMRTLLESTTMPSSADVFRTLVRQIARAMHVRSAVLLEGIEGTTQRARVVTACSGRRIRSDLEDLEVDLSRTPSERLDRESLVFLSRAAQTMHPGVPLLDELQAQAYVATAITDSDGRAIGQLVLIHDHALEGRRLPAHLLRVFATRAGAELARERAHRERLAVERKLLETQKMESLGILAGGIAHDFNNILVGILGNASLALLEAEDSSAARPFLAEIETAAMRAADLARQMLAYSGKGRFVVEDVDLNRLVREMVNLLHVSVPKKVVLRFHLEPDLPLLRIDSTQIRQVVMNLVTNGAESVSDRSGVVTLFTGMARLQAEDIAQFAIGRDLEPGDYVYLEVTDSGLGMDAETVARIFDPFFTTKFTGRGLGLAAVQGIVLGHGGGLRVQSVAGEGTSIRFFVPPSGAAAVETAQPMPSGGDWVGSGRALVVDDEETVQVATARILERLGFTVELAGDGRSALEVFRDAPEAFDVVLLDLTMPHMGGEETLLALREHRAELPVVLMSGYAEQELQQRFEGAGLAGVLQKPFTLDDVRRRLQAIFA